MNGSNKSTNKAAPIATIPPALCGIDRSIAWNGGKYRSGTICAGVTGGLASI